jgi:excisionase family DNA binding protein
MSTTKPKLLSSTAAFSAPTEGGSAPAEAPPAAQSPTYAAETEQPARPVSRNGLPQPRAPPLTVQALKEKYPYPPPSDDLLWGGAAVAAYLGVSLPQLYYLIRARKLPIAKLGRKTIVASKKKLQRAIDALAG